LEDIQREKQVTMRAKQHTTTPTPTASKAVRFVLIPLVELAASSVVFVPSAGRTAGTELSSSPAPIFGVVLRHSLSLETGSVIVGSSI
jgi:hypothetical protein